MLNWVQSDKPAGEERKEDLIKDSKYHENCVKYKVMEEEWNKALFEGNERKCPEWGIGGMKNDACTHMTCVNWGTEWWYFCGKADKDLDKEDPDEKIYSHNVDWYTNLNRCPMFFLEISQIDNRWSETDDYAWMDFFHTICLAEGIRKFFAKYTEAQFNDLCKVFPSISTHGLDLATLKTMDTTKIYRPIL